VATLLSEEAVIAPTWRAGGGMEGHGFTTGEIRGYGREPATQGRASFRYVAHFAASVPSSLVFMTSISD
jgi:hypothetical protein